MGERYVIKDRWIFDTKLNKNIHSIDCYEEKNVLDVMNGQDQRIAELEEQLKNAILLPKELHIGCKIFCANEDGVYSGKLCAVTKDIKPNGEVNIWLYCLYDNGLSYSHLIKDFGVELFATEEEAQARLRELQGE